MFSVISQKDEKLYTNLEKVFKSIKDSQINYNWLISYPELNCDLDVFNNDFTWLTGKELTDFVYKNPNIQWIWAVLSGFEKDVDKNEIFNHKLVLADEYNGYYHNPISFYHPLASIEIAPCDSSWLILISKNEDDIINFKQVFDKSEDLFCYNSNETNLL